MSVRTWADNRSLLTDLWPSYEPTDAERQLFAESLQHRDQDAVHQAIRDIRRDCERDYKPVLSEILHAVKAKAAAATGKAGDGRDYSALAEDVGKDHAEHVSTVASWTIDRRKQVVDFARNAAMVDRKPIAIDKPERWPKAFIGVIVACEWIMRERPEKAAALAALSGPPSTPPTTADPPRAGGAAARKRA